MGEGVGRPNSDDWKESLALCILCLEVVGGGGGGVQLAPGGVDLI